MARKKLSLGEKIALAATGSQEEEFPDDVEYETSAKVAELDEDYDTLKPVPRSSLRTKNIQLLDEFDTRYSGEKVSRKKLAKAGGLPEKKQVSRIPPSDDDDEDDEDMLEEEEEDEDDQDGDGERLSGDEEEEELNSSAGVLEEEEDSEMGEEDDDDSEMGSHEEEDEEGDSDAEDEGESGMQTLSLRDKEVEIEKGKATLNQIKIWDSLLEVRIRQQKMLLDCNRLPQAELFEEIVSDIVSNDKTSAIPKLIEKSQEATKTLMHELLRLQEILVARNSETKKALSKKEEAVNGESDDPMNEEITSEEDNDSDNQEEAENQKATLSKGKRKGEDASAVEKAKKMKLEEFSSAAEKMFTSFIPHRNQTIQKWNDKTQFAGGKFNKKTASQQISTLRQIQQILSNKERLIKRTQVKRSNYSVIGDPVVETAAEEGEPEENPEIFDDDDFYHQLLRELIERKTCNVNDPTQLSRHWLELQKLRTKLKKKVDTKASKGRKIRYDVHPKLVNFMAPQENATMSSTAVKELFGSLFGKTKDKQNE